MTFALIDPNWGEPLVVLTTIREAEEDAWDAACWCEEFSLYSGASSYPLPGGTKGSRERLESHGFKVLPVNVEVRP